MIACTFDGNRRRRVAKSSSRARDRTTSTSGGIGSAAAAVSTNGFLAAGYVPRDATVPGWTDTGHATATAGTTSKATGVNALAARASETKARVADRHSGPHSLVCDRGLGAI